MAVALRGSLRTSSVAVRNKDEYAGKVDPLLPVLRAIRASVHIRPFAPQTVGDGSIKGIGQRVCD